MSEPEQQAAPRRPPEKPKPKPTLKSRTSVTLWRVGTLALSLLVVGSSVYFSLKVRVERELGPGTWETWLKSSPEVQSEAEQNQQGSGTPKNLKARFWTGVPRHKNPEVVRLDRVGYSVGFSKGSKQPVWAATYLTEKNKGDISSRPSIRPWQMDTEVETRNPSSDNIASHQRWAQLVPEKTMALKYLNSKDTWNVSNRVQVPKDFSEKLWPAAWKLAETYSGIYHGLVVFAVPFYNTSRQYPVGIYFVMLRTSPKGPSAMCLFLPADDEAASGTFDPAAYIRSPKEMEDRTGVFLFAELPEDWRKYLLSPQQNSVWAK